jgi:hypothetical protein
MCVGTLRLPFAAALFCACDGLGPHGTSAQTNEALPPAPPEVRDDAPVGMPGAGSLSEQLDRSKGVIAPPASTANTDPGIVKPTPDTGASAMPVIPPPGTPGGNPNVQPK